MNALLHSLYPGDGVVLLIVNALIPMTAVILLTMFIVARWLRRWPAACHAAWFSCLMFVAACPWIALSANRAGLSLFSLPVAPQAASTRPQQAMPAVQSQPAIVSRQPTPLMIEPSDFARHPIETADLATSEVHQPATPPQANEAAPIPAAEALDFRSIIAGGVAVWAFGAVLFAIRLLHGVVYLGVLRRTTTRLDESAFSEALARVRASLGVTHLPPILVSERITTPVVVALFRPAILLPVSLVRTISQSRLHNVLVHECAHILRRDQWVGVFQRLVAIIYWPHPLIHYMNRQLARSREELCDNYVLSGVGPADYADTLLDLALRFGAPVGAASSVGLFVLRWKLEDRIRGMLDRQRDRSVRLRSGPRLRMMFSAGVIFVAATTLQVGARAPQAEEKPPAEVAQTAGGHEMRDSSTAQSTPEDQTRVEGVVVDESGQPLEGVQVRTMFALAGGSAVTAADGRFHFTLPSEIPVTPPLLAQSKDLSLIGFSKPRPVNMAMRGVMSKSSEEASTRIVLKAARAIHVTVKNSSGQPVSGASAEALGEVVSFLGSTTDQQGRATIRLHPEAKILTITALKDDAGFDYYENYRSWPAIEPDPLPETVLLTLTKPHRVRVRTVDSAGKPVPGVFVAPWVLQIPGKLAHVNFSGSSLAGQRSGPSGTCDFSWLPEASPHISFSEYVQGYDCPDQPSWDAKQPEQPVTFRLLKNGDISGSVRFPDGKPAAGIAILGEGRGATNMYFRGSTRTKTDGTYTLSIYPNQSTIVAVADHDWAAASHTAVQLGEGETREHLDFTLATGTKIRGRVTVGPKQKPASDATITLIELGDQLAAEARKLGHDRGNLVRWAQVDEKGNYEFRVGPGEFTLHLPNTNPNRDAISIKVTDQQELVYNGAAARPAQMHIRGRVVNADDGAPVGGATVYGEPVGPSGYARFEARAGSNGEFTLDRVSDTDEYGFYARAPETGLAGFKIVPSERKEVTVELHLAATVVGYVYKAGGQPVEGQKVTAIIGCDRQGCMSINVNAVTGKDGRYRIPALAVGSRCSILVETEGPSPPSENVKLDKAGEIAARDVVLPGKTAVPAKAAELRAAKTTAPTTSADEQRTPRVDLTFTGTIRDETTKKPIPGATVVVRRMVLNPSPDKYREILEETKHTTDREGHYTFTVRKEHAGAQLTEIEGQVLIEDQHVKDIEWELARGALKPDEQARWSRELAEARKKLSSLQAREKTVQNSVDANRRTYLEFDVAHAGFVEQKGVGYSLNMILKNIELGERPFFEDFRLQPGREITAVVAGPDGASLAGVPIEAYHHFSDPNKFGGFHELRTDASGRFRMTIPQPGGAALWIQPKDYAPMEVIIENEAGSSGTVTERGAGDTVQRPSAIEAPAGGDTIVIKAERADLGTLTVKSGLTLAGELVAEDGKPIAHQWVQARRVRDRNQRSSVLSGVGTTVDRYAQTDERGKVTFAPLPPGEYLVEPCGGDNTPLTGDRYRSTPIQGVFYPLKTSLSATEQKPFILKAVPTVRIVAQYYGSDGKKTSGHDVQCYGRHAGGDDYWQTNARVQEGRAEWLAPRGIQDTTLMLLTNEHGSLRFRKSADAPLQAGRNLKLGTLESDLTDIQIIRYVAPILLVRPTDASGRPIDAAEVTGQYNDRSIGESVRFEKQKDGRQRSWQLLPDEKCTITVTAPGHRPESRTISLAEGTTSELTLKLEPR